MRRLQMALIALLTLVAASPAWAQQQTWPIMQQMGVVGTWAGSCQTAASTSNWFLTFYGDASGVGRRSADRGPADPPLAVVIDSAQGQGKGGVMMRIRNDDANWGSTNGHTFDVIVEMGPSTMRTLSSTRVHDGVQMIKDGLVVASGRPALVLNRCR